MAESDGENQALPHPERRRRPRPTQASWFASLEPEAAKQSAFIEPLTSELGADDIEPPSSDDEPKFLTRQAQRIVGSGQSAFERIYRAFMGARAALGLVLAGTVWGGIFWGLWSAPTTVVVVLSSVYAVFTIVMWLWSLRVKTMVRLRAPQWSAAIGVDVALFLFLHAMSASATLNYVVLLVLPVLMAGVLTPRVVALITVGLITGTLLAVAWWQTLAGSDATLLITQAGLAGAGFLALTLLAGELARRLAREELSAKGSLELARQQAQLNELVIEEMQEGVLVVDRRGRIRTSNPAAQKLLNPDELPTALPRSLRQTPSLRELVRMVEWAFADGQWPQAGRDAVLQFEAAHTRTLRVRVRFTRRQASKANEELCVLFLEDVRSVQAKTRQEKLAAMGRVSAGIAHEIRNPLAAIAQANALMAEDATSTTAKQLTRMINNNVQRLKRIVDDVMDVAGGQVREAPPLHLADFTAEVCTEWLHTTKLPASGVDFLKVDYPEQPPLMVLFDGEHLRRVLVNLLDNARRHARGEVGSVLVQVSAIDAQWARLAVLSDGEPIPPDVERCLFEPFFSTRSRGTGLGLYICKELCERYGARIDYRLCESEHRHRNEFFVLLLRTPADENFARSL